MARRFFRRRSGISKSQKRRIVLIRYAWQGQTIGAAGAIAVNLMNAAPLSVTYAGTTIMGFRGAIQYATAADTEFATLAVAINTGTPSSPVVNPSAVTGNGNAGDYALWHSGAEAIAAGGNAAKVALDSRGRRRLHGEAEGVWFIARNDGGVATGATYLALTMAVMLP